MPVVGYNSSSSISGAGIAGLCLAAELQGDPNFRVDIYEAASKIEEIHTGASITLWGRVCEVLRMMGLSGDCIKAAMAAASKGAPCKVSNMPSNMQLLNGNSP